MTLVPAYGRDYRSKKAVLEAFYNGNDFLVADITSRWDGKPVNRGAMQDGETVYVRYGNLRKMMTFTYRSSK